MAWIQSTRLSIFMSQSTWAFGFVEMLHLIAIMLFFGLIVVIDLRLTGLVSRNWAVTRLCREVLPLAWTAFAAAAVTGSLIFTAQANDYYVNSAFRMKVVLLVAAALNMLAFHVFTWRNVAAWDRGAVPLAGRIAGAVSLASWIAIVACGRWIGYAMLPS